MPRMALIVIGLVNLYFASKLDNIGHRRAMIGTSFVIFGWLIIDIFFSKGT